MRKKILILAGFLVFGLSSFAQDRVQTLHLRLDDENGQKASFTKVRFQGEGPFVAISGYTRDLSQIPKLYFRLKQKGSWGAWRAFEEPSDGEDYDRFVFDMVLIDSYFEAIQFKSEKTVHAEYVIRLFYPEFTKKNLRSAKNPKIAQKILESCPQPAYQGRSDWCPSGNCPKQANPSIINPDHIVVHHSAGNTTSNDFAAVVRSYWDYHVNSRGWADIGYNWLVDPNGVLYEGRGDRVRGAHSPCMNAVSMGVCFIGNYEEASPAAAGLQMLKDYIAWDAADKGIDVLGSSYVSALSGNMANVSGHLDGYDQYPEAGCTATSCPGVNLYNLLPEIRSDVAAYACYIASREAPDVPESFAVLRSGPGKALIKIQPVEGATGYDIYQSDDDANFTKVQSISGTDIEIDGLVLDQVTYFKILAFNDKGASDLSSSLAVIASDKLSEILIVDGVERRKVDVISRHEYAMEQLGRSFASVTNDGVKDGLVDLSSYKFVLWMLLDESTADDTFDKAEQTLVKDFIDQNGIFIVSGNEIGWDLVQKGDATDQNFYKNYFNATYVADAPNPNNFKVIDNDQQEYQLDQSGTYLSNVYPDVIKPLNGSVRIFAYDGVSTSYGIAGVDKKTANGGVVYLGFAIEGVKNAAKRKELMAYIFNRYSEYLAVDTHSLLGQIGVYPNPVRDVLKIDNPKNIPLEKAVIYNLYGQRLAVWKKTTSMDVHRLHPGMYFLRLYDKNGRSGVFKFIKQ